MHAQLQIIGDLSSRKKAVYRSARYFKAFNLQYTNIMSDNFLTIMSINVITKITIIYIVCRNHDPRALVID